MKSVIIGNVPAIDDEGMDDSFGWVTAQANNRMDLSDVFLSAHKDGYVYRLKDGTLQQINPGTEEYARPGITRYITLESLKPLLRWRVKYCRAEGYTFLSERKWPWDSEIKGLIRKRLTVGCVSFGPKETKKILKAVKNS